MRNGLFILLLLLSSTSWSKVFRNAYIAFEMPDSWNCQLEQTEWVCRSQDSKETREAIIILTAKEVGPTDTYPLYEAHLNEPLVAITKTGSQVQSKVVYKTKQVQVNDQMWLDGLHLGSEVNNYFTRYLATIKDKVAVLVTFSAHKDFYTKYSQDFFKSIMSLRVVASKDLMNRPETGPLRPSADTLGSGLNSAFPTDFQNENGGDLNAEAPKDNKVKTIGLIILLIAIGGILIIRLTKKKK